MCCYNLALQAGFTLRAETCVQLYFLFLISVIFTQALDKSNSRFFTFCLEAKQQVVSCGLYSALVRLQAVFLPVSHFTPLPHRNLTCVSTLFGPGVALEGELQELRDLVAQLRVDNETLWQEQAVAVPGPSTVQSISAVPPTASAILIERLIFVPRDRKCPMFRGKTGIGLAVWVEEVQACMRAWHLSTFDQAFFLFGHQEGEAHEEIKFRSCVCYAPV